MSVVQGAAQRVLNRLPMPVAGALVGGVAGVTIGASTMVRRDIWGFDTSSESIRNSAIGAGVALGLGLPAFVGFMTSDMNRAVRWTKFTAPIVVGMTGGIIAAAAGYEQLFGKGRS